MNKGIDTNTEVGPFHVAHFRYAGVCRYYIGIADVKMISEKFVDFLIKDTRKQYLMNPSYGLHVVKNNHMHKSMGVLVISNMNLSIDNVYVFVKNPNDLMKYMILYLYSMFRFNTLERKPRIPSPSNKNLSSVRKMMREIRDYIKTQDKII